MGLDVTTATSDDVTVIGLTGELDIYTVPAFRGEIDAIDPVSPPLVIDLTGVTLLDSSGLGALVSVLNRARNAGGQLGLVCPQRNVRRVFEITGLRRSFVFGDDLAAVSAELKASPGPPE